MALLDEARVRQMSNGGTRGPVVVTRGDVLTPSARSWLREHRVEVVFPQGEPEKTGGGRQEKGALRAIGRCSARSSTRSRST